MRRINMRRFRLWVASSLTLIVLLSVAFGYVIATTKQHDPPKNACSHNPRASQVKCSCHRDQLPCNQEGQRPPAQGGREECSSWCFENFCLCPPPCEHPEEGDGQ